ncbi:MAG: hypothetical protein ACYTF9_04505 [Planctomycetota bacterium]|jgi:hypothetical protein
MQYAPARWVSRARLGAAAALACGLVAACGAPSSEPAPPEAPVSALENTIRWTTASEVDNYGFDVYRATAEEGPFEVINSETVPGAGTTDVPQDYEYVDRSVEPDTAYFYYVESISMGGERERMTPVIRSRPKPAPD